MPCPCPQRICRKIPAGKGRHEFLLISKILCLQGLLSLISSSGPRVVPWLWTVLLRSQTSGPNSHHPPPSHEVYHFKSLCVAILYVQWFSYLNTTEFTKLGCNLLQSTDGYITSFIPWHECSLPHWPMKCRTFQGSLQWASTSPAPSPRELRDHQGDGSPPRTYLCMLASQRA